MICFPSCKINLGLRITQKRADGFHALETVFFPISIKDALEIIIEPDANAAPITFTSSGLAINGDPSDNLCFKAYELLKKDYPTIPNIKMHLHKQIPMGAGLGGGSSDGAFTLVALNQLFDLQITEDKLMQYALTLGSDCPFFILNSPAYATSRGEILKPINVNLDGYTIIIVNPGIAISTKLAFSLITPKVPDSNLEVIICESVSTWKDNLINDFEEPIFNSFPELANIKETLYQKGAVYASMTGTGSTVYGIFPTSIIDTLDFNFPAHYFVATAS
ncbi:MAG: 4-(cytidine 5'-diphospho)-2-C-methyl-D-erythritol kinase [Sediminibacterium sp.]|nr:4-(cytidine 5'-diphospho)-2-C-methyl-D-erythritol kinase [Sediminibacterium sp.]MBP7990118.1 4-(cytidine 5'-diphospho)-2-C-methyl-D-erythritol kinase [Sediminibacterium sp.]